MNGSGSLLKNRRPTWKTMANTSDQNRWSKRKWIWKSETCRDGIRGSNVSQSNGYCFDSAMVEQFVTMGAAQARQQLSALQGVLSKKKKVQHQPAPVTRVHVSTRKALRCRDGKKGILLGGTPRTGGMEEPSALCGRLCQIWKDSTAVQAKKSWERVTLVLALAKAFERVCLPVVWVWAAHFHVSKDSTCAMRGCVVEPFQTILFWLK